MCIGACCNCHYLHNNLEILREKENMNSKVKEKLNAVIVRCNSVAKQQYKYRTD